MSCACGLPINIYIPPVFLFVFVFHLFVCSNVGLKLLRLSWCEISFPDSLEAKGDHVFSSGQSKSVLNRNSTRAIIFMTKRDMFSCHVPFLYYLFLHFSTENVKKKFWKFSSHIFTLRIKAMWFGIQRRKISA